MSHIFVSSIAIAISEIPQNAMQCSPLIPSTSSPGYDLHIFSRHKIEADTWFSYPSKTRNANAFTGSVTALAAWSPQKHVAYSRNGARTSCVSRSCGGSHSDWQFK